MTSRFRILLCSLILLATSQWLRAAVVAAGGYSGTNINHGYVNLNSGVTVTVTLSDADAVGGVSDKSTTRFKIFIDFHVAENSTSSGSAAVLPGFATCTPTSSDGDGNNNVGTVDIDPADLNNYNSCSGGCEKYFDLWVTYDDGSSFTEVDWAYTGVPDEADIK